MWDEFVYLEFTRDAQFSMTCRRTITTVQRRCVTTIVAILEAVLETMFNASRRVLWFAPIDVPSICATASAVVRDTDYA